MSFHQNENHKSNKKPLTLLNNGSEENNINIINDLTFSSNQIKISGKKQETKKTIDSLNSNNFTDDSRKVTDGITIQYKRFFLQIKNNEYRFLRAKLHFSLINLIKYRYL